MAKKLDSDLSELIRLFDCYGALLTDRQRDVTAAEDSSPLRSHIQTTAPPSLRFIKI